MIYEKRLLVLGGTRSRGCVKIERLQTGLTCIMTGNEKNDVLLTVRSNAGFFAFGSFPLNVAYKFELPTSVQTESLVIAVGDLDGKLLLSGGFSRPLPWQGNLEDDLKLGLKKLGLTSGAKRDINDFVFDISPTDYDDTKVAEVNYYSSNLVEDCAFDEVASTALAQMTDVSERREDDVLQTERQQQTELFQTAERGDMQNQEDVQPNDEDDYSRAQPVPDLAPVSFYDGVKEQVERLFEKNERASDVEKLLPGSKWVKVVYDDKRYYLVGTIGEPVKYLCYGVPGEYSPTPPRDLIGYCQWLALDVGNPSGKGYWIMYQDGITGKSVL